MHPSQNEFTPEIEPRRVNRNQYSVGPAAVPPVRSHRGGETPYSTCGWNIPGKLMFAQMINRLTGGETDKVIRSAEINSECQWSSLSGVISLLKLLLPCVSVPLCVCVCVSVCVCICDFFSLFFFNQPCQGACQHSALTRRTHGALSPLSDESLKAAQHNSGWWNAFCKVLNYRQKRQGEILKTWLLFYLFFLFFNFFPPLLQLLWFQAAVDER